MAPYHASKVNYERMRKYRLDRVRAQLKAHDYAGIVLFDPPNVRYATDVPNMQVWALHNICRYAFVATEGPVILFDYGFTQFLSKGYDLINETRASTNHVWFCNGPRQDEMISKWVGEMRDLMDKHGGGNKRLAVDKLDPGATMALAAAGIQIMDGEAMMEKARSIKSADEIVAMREAIFACEKGIEKMWRELKPGMTENELWSHLHATNIAMGGEWIECRLLTSGPRTNPWFQECSNRVIEDGDIVAFDTDLIGPNGYIADISRTWVAGDRRPTNEQHRLYQVALENLEHNLELVKPGLSFREFTEKSFALPDEFVDRRYSCIMHGVGLCDEYPFAVYPQDWDRWGFEGVFEAGMVVCIEALIGTVGGKECIKLEHQVLVTDRGYEILSTAPFGLKPEY